MPLPLSVSEGFSRSPASPLWLQLPGDRPTTLLASVGDLSLGFHGPAPPLSLQLGELLAFANLELHHYLTFGFSAHLSPGKPISCLKAPLF